MLYTRNTCREKGRENGSHYRLTIGLRGQHTCLVFPLLRRNSPTDSGNLEAVRHPSAGRQSLSSGVSWSAAFVLWSAASGLLSAAFVLWSAASGLLFRLVVSSDRLVVVNFRSVVSSICPVVSSFWSVVSSFCVVVSDIPFFLVFGYLWIWTLHDYAKRRARKKKGRVEGVG